VVRTVYNLVTVDAGFDRHRRWMPYSPNRCGGRRWSRSSSGSSPRSRCCWPRFGTYGVLSVMVAERRQEIGIRMALGADRSRVLAGIVRHGLVLTGIGVVIGLAGAFGLSRLIASLLFGVRPADTATMIGVVALVLLVAALACLRPAWRASRLDPNVVLRVG
jgi:hypothetical protein